MTPGHAGPDEDGSLGYAREDQYMSMWWGGGGGGGGFSYPRCDQLYLLAMIK